MTDTPVLRTSNTLADLELWIASYAGQKYSCTRQYPNPRYACDRDLKCEGCLIVAAALELRKANAPETNARVPHYCTECGTPDGHHDWCTKKASSAPEVKP